MKKTLIIAKSIDIEDSSGTKVNVPLIDYSGLPFLKKQLEKVL